MSIFSNTDVYDIKEATAGTKLDTNNLEKSQLTILLQKGEYDDSSLDFLKNILNAIGFNIETDCIIREFDNNKSVALNECVNRDSSKYILSFGIDLKQINAQANLDMHRWNHFERFSFLSNNKLDAIKNNINLKKNLWVELKKVFHE